MPAAVHVPLQGGPLHGSPVSITSKQLFLRESVILERAGSWDRFLARLYRFTGLDSLEQTQDLPADFRIALGLNDLQTDRLQALPTRSRLCVFWEADSLSLNRFRNSPNVIQLPCFRKLILASRCPSARPGSL